ncbi:hypothetical protein [Variovorax soli]|nr:hypothetical protein [Variovorax soli]
MSGTTSDTLRGWVREAIECDDRRHSMPHEHTAALAGGIGLILSALIVPGRTAAVLQAAAGGALLLRAAAGRDGIRKWSGAEGARPATELDDNTDSATTTNTTTTGVPTATRGTNEMGM